MIGVTADLVIGVTAGARNYKVLHPGFEVFFFTIPFLPVSVSFVQAAIVINVQFWLFNMA